MQMNQAIDTPGPFTLCGGLANTGSALNIRVYLRQNAVFRLNGALIVHGI
jgi:hypothetical protein